MPLIFALEGLTDSIADLPGVRNPVQTGCLANFISIFGQPRSLVLAAFHEAVEDEHYDTVSLTQPTGVITLL